MSERHEVMAEVRRWVRKAEHDLRNAEYVSTMEEDCPFDTICFHCQQCAEKYLKARLHESGFPVTKTHNLVHLLDLALQIEPLWESVASHFEWDWRFS